MKAERAVRRLFDLMDVWLKNLIFFGWAVFDWILIRMISPYNPNKPDSAYVIIPNKTLAKLLIEAHNPYLKYVKVKDRQKLWLPAFIAYLLLAAVLFASLVLVLLPPMPCETVEILVGRHGATISVSTYNEKVPLLLVMLFCIVEFLCILIPCFVLLLRTKKETVRSKIGFALIVLLFLFMAGWFIVKLI